MRWQQKPSLCVDADFETWEIAMSAATLESRLVASNDNQPETPEQFRARRWLAEHRPANENESGKAVNQWPLLARARSGKLCPGAVEAISWFETVLEDALADASALPSGTFVSQDEIAASRADGGQDEITSFLDLGNIDMEPTYGPTPQWLAEHAPALIYQKAPGRILAVCIIGEDANGRPFEYWQSMRESVDRPKGARREAPVDPVPGLMKGENDPQIAWTRTMHRTGQPGAPAVPTPAALYRATASRHIRKVIERLGEDTFVVLAKAIVLRQTSMQIGTAPGVSHDRARVRGNKLIEHAIDGLADYWFEVKALDKRAA